MVLNCQRSRYVDWWIWIDAHNSNAFGWDFCTGHVEQAGLVTSGSLFSRNFGRTELSFGWGVARSEELEVNQWIVQDIYRLSSQSEDAENTIHCFSIQCTRTRIIQIGLGIVEKRRRLLPGQIFREACLYLYKRLSVLIKKMYNNIQLFISGGWLLVSNIVIGSTSPSQPPVKTSYRGITSLGWFLEYKTSLFPLWWCKLKSNIFWWFLESPCSLRTR